MKSVFITGADGFIGSHLTERLIKKYRVRPKNSKVRRLKTCNKKAKRLLKWHSSSNNKSGLEKSLRETIKWYSEKNNITKFKDKS